jgi:hypothetical protein
MRYILLYLLPLSIIAETPIISEEAYKDEHGTYWHIRKEINLNNGNKVPLLFEFTNKGEGSIKLSKGIWLPIYDCSENGGSYYKPCMMNQTLKDINGDGFLDIYLSTKLYTLSESHSESYHDAGKVFAELIFNPKKNDFFLSKHSSTIKTYEYYEN